MFNVSALLLDDTSKTATLLTNGVSALLCYIVIIWQS